MVVLLLRAEASEREPRVSLKAADGGRSKEAEAVLLTLSPGSALVVDVAGGNV